MHGCNAPDVVARNRFPRFADPWPAMQPSRRACRMRRIRPPRNAPWKRVDPNSMNARRTKCPRRIVADKSDKRRIWRANQSSRV